jgi:hypothetical protein
MLFVTGHIHGEGDCKDAIKFPNSIRKMRYELSDRRWVYCQVDASNEPRGARV